MIYHINLSGQLAHLHCKKVMSLAVSDPTWSHNGMELFLEECKSSPFWMAWLCWLAGFRLTRLRVNLRPRVDCFKIKFRPCQDHVFQVHVCLDHVCQDHVFQDHVFQDHVYQDYDKPNLIQFYPFWSNLIQLDPVWSNCIQLVKMIEIFHNNPRTRTTTTK